MAKEEEQKAPVLSVDDLMAAPGCVAHELAIPELAGRPVMVRGLTKLEVQQCRTRATRNGSVDNAILEREMFLLGLVEPKLTLAQYETFITNKPAGLFYRILNPILADSGLTEEVAQQTRKAFLPER